MVIALSDSSVLALAAGQCAALGLLLVVTGWVRLRGVR